MTPTARTLQALRADGWLVEVVERWNPHARVRHDLFNVADILAVRGSETLAVQVTAGSRVSARPEAHRIDGTSDADRCGLARRGPRLAQSEGQTRREGDSLGVPCGGHDKRTRFRSVHLGGHIPMTETLEGLDGTALEAMAIVQARLLTLARTIDVPERLVLELSPAQLLHLSQQVPKWESSLDKHGHPIATGALVHYLLALVYADAACSAPTDLHNVER